MLLQGVARPQRWHVKFLNSQSFLKNRKFCQNNGINTLWIVWTHNTTKYQGFLDRTCFKI